MKRGLVLEGGGAKGAFQVGALRALNELNIGFDGVMGTSIGAVNGVLFAQGDLDGLVQLWQNIRPSQVMEIDEEMFENWANHRRDAQTMRYMLRILGGIIKQRGIRTDKMVEVLQRYFNEEKLRANHMEFGVVTVSLTDRKSVEIFLDEMEPGSVLDYVLASAYFPAFQRKPLRGKSYLDGGLYDNMPINPLIRRGYDHIVAIRTMSNMPHQKVVDPTVDLTYIKPTDALGRTLLFTHESINKNLTMGYFDTMRFYKGYWGKRYYFQPCPDLIERQEQALPASVREAVATAMGLSDSAGVMGKLADAVAPLYPDEPDLAHVMCRALEDYATNYGEERWKVWEFEDLLAHVRADLQQMELRHPLLAERAERGFRAFVKGGAPGGSA